MQKRKFFYIALLIIYLLFLSKDSLMLFSSASVDNLDNNKESYYEREYNKLSKLLNIKSDAYNIIYAKIIRRDIYDFFDTITINVGRKANIEKGNIVINDEGVIGVVKEVKNNYSEVNLITNKEINLSVKINDSYGILTSEDNKLIVKNLKLGQKLNEGDKVYTSGLTDIKEGLLIGSIKEIKKDNLELEYIIDVTPSVNFNNISYVGVIS